MMRLSILILSLMGSVALPVSAQVQCDYSGTQTQMNACAYRDYNRADAALNQAYKHAMSKLSDPTKTKLQQAQRLWIPYRDAACDAEASPFEGGSLQPLIRATCLQDLTETRTQNLLSIADF